MPLTKSFRETVKERADKDVGFRDALLKEVADAMLSGCLDDAKHLMRNYINATIGFKELARELGKNEKVVMQMLGEKGNPTSKNFFGIYRVLKLRSGRVLSAKLVGRNVGQRKPEKA